MSKRKEAIKKPPRWFQRLAMGNSKVSTVVIPDPQFEPDRRDLQQLWEFIAEKVTQSQPSNPEEKP